MAEVRRCRRCKRKRMDDEPPEVRQYKTCAKCRIIERQKKKLRKPLAEETMIYGMKQFQQQNPSSNYSDEIFMDDDVFNKKKFDNSNMNLNSNQLQFQYQYTGENGNGSNIGVGGVAGATTMPGGDNGNYIYGNNFDNGRLTGNATAMSIPQQSMSLSTNQYLQNLNFQQIAQRALPTQSTNLPKTDERNLRCDICNGELDLNDEVSINYKLCLNCYSEPFKSYNAFDDYNEFLKRISENNQKNVINHIFLKQLEKNFVDNLNSMNKVINSETQFREFILENLKKIFIEPILASIGYEFTLVSSNFNELSSTAPTINDMNQYQYKNTSPIKAYYKCVKEINNKINCESNLFLDYNLSNNFLKIKFNHKVHNFFLSYPLKFINVLYEIHNSLPDNSSFNTFVGEQVFEELNKNIDLYDEEFKSLITSIDKSDFLNEFHHLEDIFVNQKDKLLNKDLSEPPKIDDDNNVDNGDIDDEIKQETGNSAVDMINTDPSQINGSNDNDHSLGLNDSTGEVIDKILDPAFEE